MLSRRYAALDFDSPLTPTADKLLAEAVAEFDEKQHRLLINWRMGEYTRWEFDPEPSTLRFGFSDGRALRADAQLIGTFCVLNASFEWAWHNPRFPTNITRESFQVRRVGDKLGLAYLRKGMVPIQNETFLSYLCSISAKVVDADGIFRGDGEDVHTVFAIRNLAWE